MDIKNRKKELLLSLNQLEYELEILNCNMTQFKIAMSKLPDEISKEELENFEEEFDLEKDLKIIQLF